MDRPIIVNPDGVKIAEVYGISDARRVQLLSMAEKLMKKHSAKGHMFHHTTIIDEMWDYCHNTEERILVIFCQGVYGAQAHAAMDELNEAACISSYTNPN